MAGESEEFLHEIDELLSDTKENGDVGGLKEGNDAASGVENLKISEEVKENGACFSDPR